MADFSRDVPPAVADAIAALRNELQTAIPYRLCSRPVQAPFPLAATKTQVLHGLGEIPDGVLVIDAAGGTITREPGVQWTKELAFLRSSLAASQAVLVFYVLREAPINVQAHG